MADSLVILGDASIKYQGPLANLSEGPEQILKFISQESYSSNDTTVRSVSEAVRSQTLNIADAALDLSRMTGDASLYGNKLI